MTDERRQFCERLANEVSTGLATWAEQQFEAGHNFAEVRHKLHNATKLTGRH